MANLMVQNEPGALYDDCSSKTRRVPFSAVYTNIIKLVLYNNNIIIVRAYCAAASACRSS